MAKIFLDANSFIDYIESRKDVNLNDLANNFIFISPLSIHIASYLYKYKMPEKRLENISIFALIPFDPMISKQALLGPTKDFEDNVQLHSATEAKCDIFLTSDKDLLKMKFFGNMLIQPSL